MTGPAPITIGPCEPWADAADAAECCPALADTDLTILETAVAEASGLLYELSGMRFAGLCERTVRPCRRGCSCFQVLSRGHIVAWDTLGWAGGYWGYGDGRRCGCRPLSKIALTGFVREIVSVQIDGNEIDAADYRLDRHRDLVRLNGDRWPHCQRMDVDGGPGTFFVEYAYGIDPPLIGVRAAEQLACELAKSCNPAFADECALPEGTVRIARQGITIDKASLGLWLLGTQRTGMPLVDAFVSIFGRKSKRTAMITSPELDPFPLPVDA